MFEIDLVDITQWKDLPEVLRCFFFLFFSCINIILITSVAYISPVI